MEARTTPGALRGQVPSSGAVTLSPVAPPRGERVSRATLRQAARGEDAAMPVRDQTCSLELSCEQGHSPREARGAGDALTLTPPRRAAPPLDTAVLPSSPEATGRPRTSSLLVCGTGGPTTLMRVWHRALGGGCRARGPGLGTQAPGGDTAVLRAGHTLPAAGATESSLQSESPLSKCFNYKRDFEAWTHNTDTLSEGTRHSIQLHGHVSVCTRVRMREYTSACVCARARAHMQIVFHPGSGTMIYASILYRKRTVT